MSHTRAVLSIRFTDFWLSGTGAARGRQADAVAHRHNGLDPAMPMSQIKGQLRETARRLADGKISGWNAARAMQLFGGGPFSAFPAALDFSGDAVIAPALRDHLAKNANDRARLFKRIPATAINAFGVAEENSLRFVEAVVPLTIFGVVELRDPNGKMPGWVAWVDQLCAATLAFGKLKSDGFGRAVARAEGAP